jgi:DnaJ-class molecular chaperone
VQKQGLTWDEAVSKVAPKPMSLEEVKSWRTREAAAGRPSSYEEFCRVHGLCMTCLGEGVTRNDNGVGFKVVSMDGDNPLFERCPVCGGTGKQPSS